MKFKPIIGTDLSGHIGGVVASHNTYGPYFRHLVHPVNRKTAPQLQQRAAVQAISQSWRGLTDEQRETWKTTEVTKTSKSGLTVKLTGQAAWMHINTMRQRMGLPIILLPPTAVDPVIVTLPEAQLVVPNTLLLTFAEDTWNAAGGGIIVSGSPPLGPGINFWQTFAAVASILSPGTVQQSMNYPNAVGPGDKVRLRLHATDPTGRQSMVLNQDVYAEPSATTVASVHITADVFGLWTFNNEVTATGITEPKLIILDATQTPIQVLGTTQAGPKAVLVEYAAELTPGWTWNINELPTQVTATPAIKVPQSGLVLA